jgi:hypothetical protein
VTVPLAIVQEGEAQKLADRILAAIERISPASKDPDEQSRLDAIAAAARRLRQIMGRTVWDLTPGSWLAGVEGAFDPVVAAVEERASSDDAEAVLQVGWGEVERLWSALSPFLPALLPEESVSEDAAAFRRSAGQLIRRLTDEVDQATGKLESLRGELAQVVAERDTALEQIRQHQARLEATISEQADRLEQALRETQQQFTDAQDERRSQFTQELDQHKTALDQLVHNTETQTAEAVDQAEKSAEEARDRIEELEQKALKSYNTIGNASVAGHYQQHANVEAGQADLWRWIAVGVFVAAALGALIELILRGGTLEWDQTRSRLLLVIPLGALAGFAVAEGRAHRRAERESRRREVELSSLDPYLVLIQDREKAEDIKLAYARRVFVEQNGATAQLSDSDVQSDQMDG